MNELLRELEDGVRQLAGPNPSPGDLELLEQLRSTLEELRVVQEDLAGHNVELRELHDELAAERKRYLDLFELAPDAYFVTDAAGKIL
jgi:PAS domain-containing protein